MEQMEQLVGKWDYMEKYHANKDIVMMQTLIQTMMGSSTTTCRDTWTNYCNYSSHNEVMQVLIIGLQLKYYKVPVNAAKDQLQGHLRTKYQDE